MRLEAVDLYIGAWVELASELASVLSKPGVVPIWTS